MADARCPEPKPVAIFLLALAGGVGVGLAVLRSRSLEIAEHAAAGAGIGAGVGVALALSRRLWLRLPFSITLGWVGGIAGLCAVDPGLAHLTRFLNAFYVFGLLSGPAVACHHFVLRYGKNGIGPRIFAPVLYATTAVGIGFFLSSNGTKSPLLIPLLFLGLQYLALLAALVLDGRMRGRLEPPR